MSEIITDETKVFLASHPVDMRKSINGLAAIVEGSFDLDLYEDCLFVFCSKDHAKIKALKWECRRIRPLLQASGAWYLSVAEKFSQ
ncbi:MAG: IS66 family insertion sequence element accessory protein TnpB [Eubacterium sp.]|jgi:transposase|nr:IS66 family insertion sequence element accessory protein TnpB [Eubacterium sp.]